LEKPDFLLSVKNLNLIISIGYEIEDKYSFVIISDSYNFQPIKSEKIVEPLNNQNPLLSQCHHFKKLTTVLVLLDI